MEPNDGGGLRGSGAAVLTALAIAVAVLALVSVSSRGPSGALLTPGPHVAQAQGESGQG